jgi:hypothetical protein
LLARDAKAAWPGILKKIQAHAERAQLSQAAFRASEGKDNVPLMLQRTTTTPADIIAFDAIYDSMHLVRLSLNQRGVNVNNKGQGVQDFMKAFGDVSDAKVVQELWRLWTNWEDRPLSHGDASALAQRLLPLAEGLSVIL